MLERLLSPAILIINQLSYAKKFILVSLFFYIPLIGMSYILIDQAYQSILSADKKVRAGELLTEMLVVRENAERYRNIQAPNVALDVTTTPKSTQAKQAFFASFNALLKEHSEYFDGEHPGDFEKDLRKEIDAVAKLASTNGEISVATQIIDKLIAKIDQHILVVQEFSGLSSDNDPEIKAALALIRTSISDMHRNTGNIASAAFMGIDMKFLNTTTYDVLDKSYQDLTIALDALKVAFAERLPAGIKSAEIQEQFEAIVKGTDEFLFEIDEKIINPSQLPESVDDLYELVKNTVNVQYKLSDLLIDQIGERLVVKRQFAETSMMKVFFAVAAIFVITVYLYTAFYVSFRKSISKISKGAQLMSIGDMTFELTSNSNDEMGDLITRFNETSDRVRSLVKQVSESADNVYDLCNTSQSLSLETNELIRDQLDSTSRVAVAISQMSQTAKGIAEYSQNAEASVHDAQERARAGEEVVNSSVEKILSLCEEIKRASDTINELSDDSKNIAQVVVEIRGIAEQTNLLALNAAIEAARAGEQGRGFAVVADEVRSLSQRTHNSTSNIEGIIQKFLKKIDDSVETMESSLNMASETADESGKINEALDEINEKLKDVVQMNVHVNQSMSQQAEATNEIDESVLQIKDSGEQTSEKSSESTIASVSMAEETDRLKEALSYFKV